MIYKFVSTQDQHGSLEVEKQSDLVQFTFKQNNITEYGYCLNKETLRDFIGALLTIQSKMNKNEKEMG